MRKWMTDRLKRRKKGGEAGSKEKAAAPEPLQPKYFESDLGEQPQAAAVEAPRPEPEPETQADFQLGSRPLDSPEESEPIVTTPSAEARTRPTRRRRCRDNRLRDRKSTRL